jgi:hypothetical protein
MRARITVDWIDDTSRRQEAVSTPSAEILSVSFSLVAVRCSAWTTLSIVRLYVTAVLWAKQSNESELFWLHNIALRAGYKRHLNVYLRFVPYVTERSSFMWECMKIWRHSGYVKTKSLFKCDVKESFRLRVSSCIVEEKCVLFFTFPVLTLKFKLALRLKFYCFFTSLGNTCPYV